MHREIKVRGWDGDLKQMLPAIDLSSPKSEWKWLGVNDVALMQYTGFKDKNGKEIYEGDVVHADWLTSLYVVQWRPLEAQWSIGGSWPESTEIIGNIYENSELLKV